MKCIAAVMLFASAFVSAQTFTTLVNFDTNTGSFPSGLVQGPGGDLYGVAFAGGAYGGGTAFKVTTTGSLTVLHSFCQPTGCTDGTGPDAALVLAGNGQFYGTTLYGGSTNCNFGCGVVFQMSPAGLITTLHTFDLNDGSYPAATLVQGPGHKIWGTTSGGGNGSCLLGCGTVFALTADGTFSSEQQFSMRRYGGYPESGLVLSSAGNLYGTTELGGEVNHSCASSCGTIFIISPANVLRTLFRFSGDNGSKPIAALVQGSDGNLYGTTLYGGTGLSCVNGCGTIFKITPAGALTTLHHFNQTDGAYPTAPLIQGADGNFYGTTEQGGTSGFGTLFQIGGDGTFKSLYSFNMSDGASPKGGLIQASDGNLYGVTDYGGSAGDGTLFSLTLKQQH